MNLFNLILGGAAHLAAVALFRAFGADDVQLAIAPIIAAAGITGGAGIISSLLGKGGSIDQIALETPEQRAARQKLLEFANTGKFGEFQAGAEVPLGYGDFGVTPIEQTGQTKLQELLAGGIPDQYRLGDEALRGFLETDPAAIQAQFEPFRAQVGRQISESERALKRGAGFAGNLYSTDTIRNLGDLQARGTETLTSELARLTNEQAGRRLAAVPLAYQSAEAQQGAKLQQIAASQQYGALTRNLNDSMIKARDAELLRRRTELQLPIQAAQTVAGASSQFGVPSVQAPSPYQDLLGLVGQIGGSAISNELAYSQYQRRFPGTPPPPPPTPTYTPGYGMLPYRVQ